MTERYPRVWLTIMTRDAKGEACAQITRRSPATRSAVRNSCANDERRSLTQAAQWRRARVQP